MLIAKIIIMAELIFINLFTAHICSKRKYKNVVVFSVLAVFTAGFTIFYFFLNQANSNPYDGSGATLFSGFIYILPLVFLYKQPVKYTFLIMCYSWIYILLAYSFSFRIGDYFGNEDNHLYIALGTQTLLIAVTFPFFLKLVKGRFMYILHNVDNLTMNLIVLLSLSFFILLAMGNYSSVRGLNDYTNFAILFLIGTSAVTSYRVFYLLVSANKHAEILSEKAKIDFLTKIKNRESMYEDARELISEGKEFTIIYMDLDDFKAINDQFGHLIGDEYLVSFVNSAIKTLGLKNNFYRMAGDEFIIIYQGDRPQELCLKLNTLKFPVSETKNSFRGLSWGMATYPTDADNLKALLNKADVNMYEEKKEKYRLEVQ